jgi:hypothetical protein
MPPMAAVNGDLERALPNGSAGTATGHDPARLGESSVRTVLVRSCPNCTLCLGY